MFLGRGGNGTQVSVAMSTLLTQSTSDWQAGTWWSQTARITEGQLHHSSKLVQSVFNHRVIHMRMEYQARDLWKSFSSPIPQWTLSQYTEWNNSESFYFFRTFLLNSEKSWKIPLSDEKNFIKMNKRKKTAKSFTLYTSTGSTEKAICANWQRDQIVLTTSAVSWAVTAWQSEESVLNQTHITRRGTILLLFHEST